MATDAFGLTPGQVLGLTISQCIMQGCLIPLMVCFLTTRSSRPFWFKVYVALVNTLSLAQTAISIVQAFDLLNSAHYREPLVLAYSSITAVNSTLVQLFFIDRCWKIFKRRTPPAIPLLLLALTGLVAGIIMVVYKAKVSEIDLVFMQDQVNPALREAFAAASWQLKIAVRVWVFSSFILDTTMTTTTVVFLYRSRTDVIDHRNVFKVIWRVMWASAAPPMMLMVIIIVTAYIVKTESMALTALAMGSTGKFFTLSLMINLVGQKLVRRQFERSRPSVASIFQAQPHSKPGVISEPFFAHTRTPSLADLDRTSSGSSQFIGFALEGPEPKTEREEIDKEYVSIATPQEPEACYTPHKIQFSKAP